MSFIVDIKFVISLMFQTGLTDIQIPRGLSNVGGNMWIDIISFFILLRSNITRLTGLFELLRLLEFIA
jgi:hypothetical protein